MIRCTGCGLNRDLVVCLGCGGQHRSRAIEAGRLCDACLLKIGIELAMRGAQRRAA